MNHPGGDLPLEAWSAAFHRDGYALCHGLLPAQVIGDIRSQMLEIMRPYCQSASATAGDLDAAFAHVTRTGRTLRGNVYKLCSRLAALPMLLAEPNVRALVTRLGMKVPVIQAYSVLCMEPFEDKYLFQPHQDLKQRMSASSIAFWIPLNGGRDIGGLRVVSGSHRLGPLKHSLSAEGHLVVPPSSYAGMPVVDLDDYAEGDCLVFHPYLVHWSIPNEGERLRWTISLKIDEAAGSTHLETSLHPFVIEDYIDTRSNEERLASRGSADA